MSFSRGADDFDPARCGWRRKAATLSASSFPERRWPAEFDGGAILHGAMQFLALAPNLAWKRQMSFSRSVDDFGPERS